MDKIPSLIFHLTTPQADNHWLCDFHGISNPKTALSLGTKSWGINYGRFTAQYTKKPNDFFAQTKWKGRKSNCDSSHVRYVISDSMGTKSLHQLPSPTGAIVLQSTLRSHCISDCVSIYIVFLLRVWVSSPVMQSHRSQCIPVYVNYRRRPSSLCGWVTQSSVGRSGRASHRGKTNTTSRSAQEADLLKPTTAVSVMCCPRVVRPDVSSLLSSCHRSGDKAVAHVQKCGSDFEKFRLSKKTMGNFESYAGHLPTRIQNKTVMQ